MVGATNTRFGTVRRKRNDDNLTGDSIHMSRFRCREKSLLRRKERSGEAIPVRDRLLHPLQTQRVNPIPKPQLPIGEQ